MKQTWLFRWLPLVLIAAFGLGSGLGLVSAAEAPQPVTRGKQVSWQEAAAKLQESVAVLEKIDNYTGLFIKREVVNGKLQPYEHIRIKLRHEPFSVYLSFQKPEAIRGQQALYVEGKYDNKIIGRGVGLKALLGTVRVDPTSPLAMEGSRCPITQIGMKNTVQQVLQDFAPAPELPPTQARIYRDARLEGRPCLCVEVVKPPPPDGGLGAAGRVFLDRETLIPLRYEDYELSPGGEEPAKLVGEYTYLQLKFNTGLTDRDFDPTNPNYALAD